CGSTTTLISSRTSCTFPRNSKQQWRLDIGLAPISLLKSSLHPTQPMTAKQNPIRIARWEFRELWLIDSEKKEVDARSFEAVKNTVYKIGENLRSEVLPKIEVPVSVLFS